MTPQNPAVTIGLMTHNYGHYIREAIESVLAQTRVDWEMIVSDDASTDDTAEVVAPYLRDPRIRYVRHTENLGQARHWAYLLAQGTAPVVGVLHADDFWLPGALAAVLPEFATNPEVDLVFGNWRRRSGDAETEVRLNKTETLTGHGLYRRQVKQFTCLASGAFLTRHVAQRAGLPDASLRMVVDYEYFLRVAAHARQVRSLAAIVVTYRVHNQSTTHECTQNGVLNAERERLILLCSRQLKTIPALRGSLKDLSYHHGKALFREGCIRAAHGDRQAGIDLMQRGLHLSKLLLADPRRALAYWMCGSGTTPYALFQHLSQRFIGEASEAA